MDDLRQLCSGAGGFELAGGALLSLSRLARSVDVDAVVVAFRCADDGSDEVGSFAAVSAEAMGRAAPWRRFRWHHGQKHFSGTYWSGTEVDVKPAARLQDPKVAFTFAWTDQVVRARGWRYEIWSEPDPVELANVRFLAGYRRGWLFDPGVVEVVRDSMVSGMSIGEALGCVSGFPPATVRAALLHLLWRQEFTVDMSAQLRSATTLRAV